MSDRLGEWVRSVARAFGLGEPTGCAEHSRSSSPTWRLETAEGVYLVKTIPRGFEERHAAAMRFERRAAEAGIGMPRAVEPVEPAYGFVADVRGEHVRVYPWHEPIASSDAAHPRWLGETLRTLHDLEPLQTKPEPQWYGIDTAHAWERRIAEGQDQRRIWAEPLRRRKQELLDRTAWVAEAFDQAGDYVFTHRDVEPWNVLHTASGPLLLDWDTAGPDSASLEAGHAILDFASHQRGPSAEPEPDPAYVREACRAYGRPLARDRILARRLGMAIGRMAERIDAGFDDARVRDRLEGLPTFVANLQRWTKLFPSN